MTLPRITQGFGVLTPPVWQRLMQSTEAAERPVVEPHRGQPLATPSLGAGHQSNSGTFLAKVTAAQAMDGGVRWKYTWTQFFPYIDDFRPGAQSLGTVPSGSHSPQVNPDPEGAAGGAWSGSPAYSNYIDSSFSSLQQFPPAYNLAEWNNSGANQNTIDMSILGDDWQVESVCADSAALVAMYWTRVVSYPEEFSEGSSGIFFYFSRQNHFSGSCSGLG